MEIGSDYWVLLFDNAWGVEWVQRRCNPFGDWYVIAYCRNGVVFS